MLAAGDIDGPRRAGTPSQAAIPLKLPRSRGRGSSGLQQRKRVRNSQAGGRTLMQMSEGGRNQREVLTRSGRSQRKETVHG